MRMKGDNVIDAANCSTEIFNAISVQLKKGKYASSDLYGDGFTGGKIADCLASFQTEIQKTINY